MTESAELIRLRQLVRAFADAHRKTWPVEPYTVPHRGPYVTTATYHAAVRALLAEADREVGK